MVRFKALTVLVILLVGAGRVRAEGVEEKPVWLVVTRPMFRQAMMPLLRYRKSQGWKALISTDPPELAISRCIRRPVVILLVGDDEPGEQSQGWYLPSVRRELYQWRHQQEKTYASDMSYGDLDGDSVVDVPVGRLPVRDVKTLEAVIDRICAYEERPANMSDLRLVVWAGSANYNPLVDNLSTVLLINSVNQLLPGWVNPFVLAANTTSPFCGWPEDQPSHFVEQLETGGILGMFIGHANRDSLYGMYYEGSHIFLSESIMKQTHRTRRSLPPLLLATCSVNDFTGETPCIGESMFFMESGPPAVIGPSTESHPLPNCYMCLSTAEELGRPHATIGDFFLAVQKRTLSRREVFLEMTLKDVEGKLEEEINIRALQRDHHLMYIILGDPAMRMKLPKALSCTLKIEGNVGHWQVDRPEDADRLLVTFRAFRQTAPGIEWPLKQETANACLYRANRIYGFETLATLDGSQEWSGQVEQEGLLRLAALGKSGVYVKTFFIKLNQATVTTDATIQ